VPFVDPGVRGILHTVRVEVAGDVDRRGPPPQAGRDGVGQDPFVLRDEHPHAPSWHRPV
jgi:hypothetical protein